MSIEPWNLTPPCYSSVVKGLMKKALLIAAPILAVGILAFAIFLVPLRFKLQSTSPSGKARVIGLRFQGSEPHPLDGTLRVFASHEGTQRTQQTSTLWGRDLSIEWRDVERGERFAITKHGAALGEFNIVGTGLKCVRGEKYLAADPYDSFP